MKIKEEYFTIIKEIEENHKRLLESTPYLIGAMYQVSDIPVDIFEEIADHYKVFTTYGDLSMKLETILYCDFGIKIYLYSEKCEKIQETKYVKL